MTTTSGSSGTSRRTYARGTEVSAARSRDEIERILERFGASGFTYGWEKEGSEPLAALRFKVRGRQFRFLLPLPTRDDFYWTPDYRRLSEKAVTAAHTQAVNERWRALALIIKAKLVAVESGVASLESEMLPYVVLPGGRTVAETVGPQLDAAYASGGLPSILALPAATTRITAIEEERPQ